jgi:hypothetical protein
MKKEMNNKLKTFADGLVGIAKDIYCKDGHINPIIFAEVIDRDGKEQKVSYEFVWEDSESKCDMAKNISQKLKTMHCIRYVFISEGWMRKVGKDDLIDYSKPISEYNDKVEVIIAHAEDKYYNQYGIAYEISDKKILTKVDTIDGNSTCNLFNIFDDGVYH